MFSQTYYLIRSKIDGRYLSARPEENQTSYLLLFREDFDALSYLNTHASDLGLHRLAVESISGSQLSGVLKRWGFQGIGVVSDPLLPKIEFLQQS